MRNIIFAKNLHAFKSLVQRIIEINKNKSARIIYRRDRETRIFSKRRDRISDLGKRRRTAERMAKEVNKKTIFFYV